MSATIKYKGNTIATASNNTKTLLTAGKYMEANVVVTDTGGGGGATLQTKSVSYTPSETAISDAVLPDAGYDGMDEVNVSVGAISSTYVGSGVARNDSTDLTASGATVTAPSGYYSANATKTIPNASQALTDAYALYSGDLEVELNTSSGGYVANGNQYLQFENFTTPVPATTYYATDTDQVIMLQNSMAFGAQTIKGVTTTNLSAANIKKDVVVQVGDSADPDRIVSVTGTYEGGGGGTSKVLINESVITSDTAYIEVSNIAYDNILITTNGLKTAKTSGMGALLEVQGSVCGSKTSVLFNGNVFASISSQAGFCRFEDLGNGYKLGTRSESPALPDNNLTIRYVGQSSNIAAGAYQYGDITRIKISPSESGYPFTGGTVRIYGW